MVATQQLQMMTFVHVIQSCSQDSNAVLAIMEDVIGKLKAIVADYFVVRCVTYRLALHILNIFARGQITRLTHVIT